MIQEKYLTVSKIVSGKDNYLNIRLRIFISQNNYIVTYANFYKIYDTKICLN